jgi:argininosuccinate lyase
VQSACRHETGDAAILWRGMSLADLAHVVMLMEVQVLPADVGARLLPLLLELHRLPAEAFTPDPTLGDLYSNREAWISGRDPEAAGWLSAGRARREASTIGYHVAVRGRLLELTGALTDLALAILDQAAAHVETLMPDYTYLQHAHPTTFAHYLTSFVYPMLRDLERLQACFRRVNVSPGGGGSINGSRLPLDRRRLASLLGFDDVVPNPRDAMWQADGPVEVLAAVVALLLNLDRLAEDLMIWTTQEFGLVELADRHSRCSVIMPQKKNPYALAFVRGVTGVMIGRLASMAGVGKTPSAQVDNRIFAYGEVPRSLDQALEVVRLLTGVMRELSVNAEVMARRVGEGYAQATDLAEVIMRQEGLNYRDAHRVVALVVRLALERGLSMREVGSELIDEAARRLFGRPLSLSRDLIAEAVDPARAVASRVGQGGAAPESTRNMIAECREAVSFSEDWCMATRSIVATAEDHLVEHAALLAEPGSGNGARSTKGSTEPWR